MYNKNQDFSVSQTTYYLNENLLKKVMTYKMPSEPIPQRIKNIYMEEIFLAIESFAAVTQSCLKIAYDEGRQRGCVSLTYTGFDNLQLKGSVYAQFFSFLLMLFPDYSMTTTSAHKICISFKIC